MQSKLCKNGAPLNGKSQRKARIFPSEGRRLLSCIKDRARSKITCENYSLFLLGFLCRLEEEEMEKIAACPISVYNASDVF